MSKGIMFFLGLLFGILICVLLFYYDVKFFNKNCPKCEKKEIVTRVKTDTVYVETPRKYPKQTTTEIIEDSITTDNLETTPPDDESSTYDAIFSFDNEETDEIFSDQLLKTKTVKVKILSQEKHEIDLPDDFFQYFEIQLWSTLIKNKITYFRDKNMLKIKGMEIENVNVVFLKNDYYLETGNRYYAIPEKQSFDKLNLIQIP
ncbi:MAG: hypothetical protein FWH59_00605 [Lentimicrobiaceae bacterium]|nr:hypothetical protein [Lentimicrobiaceae bacterium]